MDEVLRAGFMFGSLVSFFSAVATFGVVFSVKVKLTFPFEFFFATTPETASQIGVMNELA